ncbi:MAG: hypothetical protein BWK76_13335 [Desulfobulbaceae bacterium A2]|nr:MAG: hypothetical protein BWK76_13335 [Desulfobulbaceae bacterium A2]
MKDKDLGRVRGVGQPRQGIRRFELLLRQRVQAVFDEDLQDDVSQRQQLRRPRDEHEAGGATQGAVWPNVRETKTPGRCPFVLAGEPEPHADIRIGVGIVEQVNMGADRKQLAGIGRQNMTGLNKTPLWGVRWAVRESDVVTETAGGARTLLHDMSLSRLLEGNHFRTGWTR